MRARERYTYCFINVINFSLRVGVTRVIISHARARAEVRNKHVDREIKLLFTRRRRRRRRKKYRPADVKFVFRGIAYIDTIACKRHVVDIATIRSTVRFARRTTVSVPTSTGRTIDRQYVFRTGKPMRFRLFEKRR